MMEVDKAGEGGDGSVAMGAANRFGPGDGPCAVRHYKDGDQLLKEASARFQLQLQHHHQHGSLTSADLVQSYQPGTYASNQILLPVRQPDPREEALNNLLENFHNLTDLAGTYSSCITRNVKEIIESMENKLITTDHDKLTLSDLKKFLVSLEEATKELTERKDFVGRYLSKCLYVGFGDSPLLDRILRSHPEQEVYLFFFNYSEKDETSPVWKLFHHVLAYMQNNVSLCVLV